MTRSTAREIAIQLGFAAANAGIAPQELIDGFFSEEYYSTLKAEDELYSEYPDKKQLDYITRLTLLISEHKDEADGYIERYAKGWRPERISKTALAVLRCALIALKARLAPRLPWPEIFELSGMRTSVPFNMICKNTFK